MPDVTRAADGHPSSRSKRCSPEPVDVTDVGRRHDDTGSNDDLELENIIDVDDNLCVEGRDGIPADHPAKVAEPCGSVAVECDLCSAGRVQVLHNKAVVLIKGDGEVVRQAWEGG